MLRFWRKTVRKLAGILLLIPAAASDISLEVLMRLFPRACIWRDLLQMLLMVVFTAMWVFILSGLVLLWEKGPATLTAEILLSVRACVRARQEHGTRGDILFETKIELRNDVISALLGMCQAIVTMTTSTMICIRCLMNLLLWSSILSCIILITCDGLAVVVTG